MKDHVDALISGYLDDTLNHVEMAELEAWIQADPANARSFAQAIYFEERLAAEMKLDGIDRTSTPAKNPVARPTLHHGRWTAGITAMAAAFALAAGVALWWPGQQSQAAGESFALVLQTHDAEWAGDRAWSTGDRLAPQTLSLKSGIVHLAFDSGVEITLQGPARFELQSVELTRLHTGVVACTVPPGAEGFRVDTPTARVTDLGTAFGVRQSDDGLSEVTVFDGEVEVVTNSQPGPRRLIEGESVQLGADGSVRDVEFATEPFEKLWPAASGIVGSTGAFAFAPPFPRPLRMLQSDTEIHVVPENYPIQLQQPCPLDIAATDSATTEILVGSRVRSYLLQYNPATGDPTTLRGQARRIEGSITFDRPIVGLIVESATLQATDALFASRWGMGPGMARGLELTLPHHADVVSLSEDRRTVTLKLVVLDRLSDHVRVIVEATLPELAAR